MSKARRSFSKRWKSAAPEARSPAAWKRPFFVATDKFASNAGVANTIPRNRAVVQLGRTLEWGSRGRGFKSRRPEILLCLGTQTFSLCDQQSYTPLNAKIFSGQHVRSAQACVPICPEIAVLLRTR